MPRKATIEQLNRCTVVPLYHLCMASKTGQKCEVGCYGCINTTKARATKLAKIAALPNRVRRGAAPIKTTAQFRKECEYQPEHDQVRQPRMVAYDAEKLDFLVQVRQLNETMDAAFTAYRQAHPFVHTLSKNAMKKKKKNKRRA